MSPLITWRNLGYLLGLWLLLVTQQAAFAHEIGHQVHSGTEIADAGGIERAEAACALCPAYAQVVTPAFTHSFQIPMLERCAPDRSAPPRQTRIDAAAPCPRNRGPPAL
jgi:hypothetical protein